ncbi:hypothetical protein MHBO_000547 [Bonamia ostreae]|uniref:Uncharacterized protein n=1 Tax=Bonamia ostreae TaxID=126728 RepID=A0ABV2AFZ2_9EUKA
MRLEQIKNLFAKNAITFTPKNKIENEPSKSFFNKKLINKDQTVILSNYPEWWSTSKLEKIFLKFGKVKNLKIIFPIRGKRFCKTTFYTRKEAKNAVDILNSTIFSYKIVSAALKSDLELVKSEESKNERSFGDFGTPSNYRLLSLNFQKQLKSTEKYFQNLNMGRIKTDSNDIEDSSSSENTSTDSSSEERVFFRKTGNSFLRKGDYRVLRMGSDSRQPPRKVCIYFQKGICRKLTDCTFMHFWPEDICQRFIRGDCDIKDCNLVHVDSENRIYVPSNGQIRNERRFNEKRVDEIVKEDKREY